MKVEATLSRGNMEGVVGSSMYICAYREYPYCNTVLCTMKIYNEKSPDLSSTMVLLGSTTKILSLRQCF